MKQKHQEDFEKLNTIRSKIFINISMGWNIKKDLIPYSFL